MPLSHRAFVAQGTPNPWSVNDGQDMLKLLKRHGLKPSHRLLDFGCGSLRVGRWLIKYLNRGRYFGIDPNTWLIEAADQCREPSPLGTESPLADASMYRHDASTIPPDEMMNAPSIWAISLMASRTRRSASWRSCRL